MEVEQPKRKKKKNSIREIYRFEARENNKD